MKRLLLLAGMLLFVVSFTATAQLSVGDEAPDFKLKNIDGQWVSLSDYDDEKGVIVVFTCNHCPYAKLYESRIVDLQKDFGPKGFPVVAINPNDSTIVAEDSYSKMISNAAEKGFNFPYLLDDVQLFKQYGATRTPHVYLLKNQGDNFTVAYIGAIDDNSQDANDVEERYLANAIQSLLKGKAPEIAETKAVGCTIKFHK
ncbi:thioredoxin family protein [Geofilum rubicundum]|nr:thioredoxin family protein [Geofilum rubicundum]